MIQIVPTSRRWNTSAVTFIFFGSTILGCGNSNAAPLSFPDATFGSGTGSGKAKDAGRDTGIVLQQSSGGQGCSSTALNQTGCTCATVGQSVACYTGPPGTRGMGSCMDGTQVCQSRGEFNAFGPCTGQVLPSSPTACGSFTPPPDAAGVAEGALCTVGSVLPGPDGGAPQMGGQVWYCDSIGTWDVFPSGGCSPSACLACLQANCASTITDGLASCSASLRVAFDWLAQCGPDRSNYFGTLGGTCTDTSTGALLTCKDNQCVSYGDGGVGQGAPCSLW